MREAIAALSVDSSQPGQPSANELRKRHANVQDRIQGLWNTVHLFYKAIDKFEGLYHRVHCITFFEWGIQHKKTWKWRATPNSLCSRYLTYY